MDGQDAIIMRGMDFERWLRNKTQESGITDLGKACGTPPDIPSHNKGGNNTQGPPHRRNIQALLQPNGRSLQTTTTTGVTNNTMESN